MDTRQAREPALDEAPKLYAIVVTGTNGEMDPHLAAAMEEVHQASLSNPDNFYNNPQKHREALEGLGRMLAERQEENRPSPTRSWRLPDSACTANDHHSRLGALIASPPQVPPGRSVAVIDHPPAGDS